MIKPLNGEFGLLKKFASTPIITGKSPGCSPLTKLSNAWREASLENKLSGKLQISLESWQNIVCRRSLVSQMDWPNPQDYQEAIQFPATCFADPNLRTSRVELSPMGLPRPVSGAFTNVYKLSADGKDCAIRCFHSDFPDLHLRYSKIVDRLSSLHANWLIKTEFIETGMKVHGTWFPIVKMDWANGLPLDRYLAKHGNNQTKVNSLVQQLRNILADMKASGIAHGDLQHGNILVVDDQVKLIDYDGFFVPELAGMMSAELGHANYQHPFRSREHFGPYIDNFPAWLITISLMSLAADPELLSYSKDRECLLFAHADLLRPYESRLFAKLREHPQEEIQNATRTLIRLLDCPVDLVPFLDASDDELLNLPTMDPIEQMRVIDANSQTEPARFVERPPVLSALEKLSTTKRGTKDRLGLFIKSASARGGAMLSSVLQQKQNSHDYAEKGDRSFINGNYAEATEFYVKAVAEIKKDKELQEKNSKSMRAFKPGDGNEVFDYDKFEDNLNLQLGKCQLLNNNPAASVFHFKSVMKRHDDGGAHAELLDSTAGLMMAYCQLNRNNDAISLLEETCSWKKHALYAKGPPFSANNLSCTMLEYGNGPLAAAPGLSAAIKLVAAYFVKAAQYEHAASLYEAARSIRGGAGSANDLDLILSIGQCHLLNRRPDLALHHLHTIAQTAAQSDPICDRAAVAEAVAFKMMNSRQDVAKAMRTRMPEQLYNCLKNEMEGPLSDLEELSEVIVAFAEELGEANLMGGLRMATRLAADNYKRLDDKKVTETIIELLNDGKFLEADRLCTEDLLMQGDLRSRFADSVQVFARHLGNVGAYDQAFELLAKYKCETTLLVDAIEGKVIRYIRAATRDRKWIQTDFQEAMVILESLCSNKALSEELCKYIADAVCSSSDRSDEFLFDVRQLADLMAQHHPDGPSNPQVLAMRMFALNAESSTPLPKAITDIQPVSKLGSQFEKATRASTVSARSRQLENEVLAILRQASQKHWDPETMGQLLGQLEEMKRQRALTSDFCQRLATSLLDYLTQSSAMNRWSKETKSIPAARRESTKASINKIMDLFATVSGIDAATLRKVQKCVEKI